MDKIPADVHVVNTTPAALSAGFLFDLILNYKKTVILSESEGTTAVFSFPEDGIELSSDKLKRW